MGNAASRASTKWVAANLKQVKVAVNPEVSSAFKSACEAAGVSMAGDLSRFMSEYCKAPKKRAPESQEDVSTRRKRRKSAADMICRMERVRDAEICYVENAPENLRGASTYESAEESAALMDEVVDLLGSIY